MRKLALCLLAALSMAGPSRAGDERRPEDMLAEAYARLRSHPDEAAIVFRGENASTWDNEFWRADRWFSQPLAGWLARYERCGGELDVWDRDMLGVVRRGKWALSPDAPKNAIIIARANTPEIVGQRTLLDFRKDERRALTTDRAHVEVEFGRPHDERTFYFVREKGGWRIDGVVGMRHCEGCDGRRSVYHLPDDRRLGEACAAMASAPAPSRGERRPEAMLTEAYERLEDHPGERDDAFWRSERWFSREFRGWISRYRKCGGDPEIWSEGGGKSAVRDVAIGMATAGPKGTVSGSYPVRDYRTRRVLSRLDDEGASASVEFTYRDRYRENPFRGTKENREETRNFLFVREGGEWRIDGVGTGFGGSDGAYLPSDSALRKACGPSPSSRERGRR